MNHQDFDSNPRMDEECISSATSVQEIIRALAKRGCSDLTWSVDPSTCSQNPYAFGGFCDIYRGKLYDGTQVAIKSLRVCDGPEADSQREKILKHAARELYHWSKLRHPNVLCLLGLMLFRDRIAMVSNWMDNGSLMSFLRKNPDADRILLCRDVCAGLCYIHARGMIHGDLKAANVMVSSHGVAMIADFGNAQLKDLTLKFSNTGRFSTTLRWTAPELLGGDESIPPTREADVYACGMTMLEVLTGEVPFGAKKDREILFLVLQKKLPSRPAAALPDGIWEVVEACWAWSPDDRPSIESVYHRLQALHSGYNHRADGSSYDHLEDPLQAEFVTEAEVDSLFYSYFAHLNSIIGLLDPRLHTAPYVRHRSTILFTKIIAVSSKFFLPRVHKKCHELSRNLIGRALAADICNIEYIQALSLSTCYKDADDASGWRKLGLAIWMAYDINLHEFRTQPLPMEELEAREQLNRERTWIQLVLSDSALASQRNKPNMVPDHDLPDVEGWVRDHSEFPCYADAQLAGSFSFLIVCRLIQSTRSSMMSSKPGGFDPTIRHLFRMLDGTPKFWATLEDASAGLAPVSRSIMRFSYFSTQLSINELQMLSLVNPSLEVTQASLHQCKDSAMLVLRHVVEDMAPNGYVQYTQDGIAFATAYAGVWLYKHLARFELAVILEITGLFQAVVDACEKQSRQPKDMPSYFAKFFSHLVRNSGASQSPIHQIMNSDGAQPQTSVAGALFPDIDFPTMDYQKYVSPELMPPLDGMDAHWINVMNGLDDWWKNYTYLASLTGYPSQ